MTLEQILKFCEDATVVLDNTLKHDGIQPRNLDEKERTTYYNMHTERLQFLAYGVHALQNKLRKDSSAGFSDLAEIERQVYFLAGCMWVLHFCTLEERQLR